MSSNQELVNEIFIRIQTRFPELKATRENITKPNGDFVFRLFSAYVRVYLEHLSYVVGSRVELGGSGKLTPILDLYKKVSPIYSKLSIKIYLTDLVEPQPKRIINLLQTGLHFLDFFNQKLPSLLTEFAKVLSDDQSVEELSRMRQEKLESLAECAEAVAEADDTIGRLEIEKIKAQNQLEDKKNERNVQQSLKADKLATFDRLVAEYNNMQQTIEGNDSAEKQLKERIVTDEEYAMLMETLASGKQQLKDLEATSAEYDDGIDTFQAHVTTLEAILCTIKSIDLDLKEEEHANSVKQRAQIEAELKQTQDDIASVQANLEEKQRLRDAAELSALNARNRHSVLVAESQQKTAELQQNLDAVQEKNREKVQEYQRLQVETRNVEAELKRCKNEMAKFQEDYVRHMDRSTNLVKLILKELEIRGKRCS